MSDAGTRETTRWRGADSLVRAMETGGVGRVFALSGNQIMSVFDAAIDSGVELLHVRHEAAAVHMADAFGRLTGRPGVALVTAGPGFANTLSALYVARMAESPLDTAQRTGPRTGTMQARSSRCTRRTWRAPLRRRRGRSPREPIRDWSWPERSASRPPAVPVPVHLALPVDLLEGDALRPRPA